MHVKIIITGKGCCCDAVSDLKAIVDMLESGKKPKKAFKGAILNTTIIEYDENSNDTTQD